MKYACNAIWGPFLIIIVSFNKTCLVHSVLKIWFTSDYISKCSRTAVTTDPQGVGCDGEDPVEDRQEHSDEPLLTMMGLGSNRMHILQVWCFFCKKIENSILAVETAQKHSTVWKVQVYHKHQQRGEGGECPPPPGIWMLWHRMLFSPAKYPKIFALFSICTKTQKLFVFLGWKSCPFFENLLATPMKFMSEQRGDGSGVLLMHTA